MLRAGLGLVLGLSALLLASPRLQAEVIPAARASFPGFVAAQVGIVGLCGCLALCGMVLYFASSGASYWWFFAREQRRHNRRHRLSPQERNRSWGWAVLSLAGNALLTAPFQYAIFTGESRVYFSIGDYGWGYLLVSVGMLLIFTETAIYWVHRGLHHPWCYRRFHYYHHQFREPTPWASVAFHPLDSFAQAAPYHLAAFLFPMHLHVYLSALLLVSVWSVSIHDQVSFVARWWFNGASHHTVHHVFNRHNYGQYLTIWDRLAGTHREPKEALAKRGSGEAAEPSAVQGSAEPSLAA